MSKSNTTAARRPTQYDADIHGVTLDWFAARERELVPAVPPVRGGSPTSAPKPADWGWRVFGEICEAERRIRNRRAYHARLDMEAGSSRYTDLWS